MAWPTSCPSSRPSSSILSMVFPLIPKHYENIEKALPAMSWTKSRVILNLAGYVVLGSSVPGTLLLKKSIFQRYKIFTALLEERDLLDAVLFRNRSIPCMDLISHVFRCQRCKFMIVRKLFVRINFKETWVPLRVGCRSHCKKIISVCIQVSIMHEILNITFPSV